jgi:hypothetical protein
MFTLRRHFFINPLRLLKSKSPDRFAKGATNGSVPHVRVVFINYELNRALEHDYDLAQLFMRGLCSDALDVTVCGRDSGHAVGRLQFFAMSQPLQRTANFPSIVGMQRREAQNEY